MAFALDHVRAAPRRLFPSVFVMLDLARQRRALARLDAARLADLGITPFEADQEINRPVWDIPQHWTR